MKDQRIQLQIALWTTACVVTEAFGNPKGIKLNQVTRGNQYLILVKPALMLSIM